MQVILLVLILVFMFTAYVTSPKIGSPRAMYDLLQEAAARAPVDGNAKGSYLTMRSTNGLIFGVVNLIGSEFLESGPNILLYVFILTLELFESINQTSVLSTLVGNSLFWLCWTT